MGRNRRSPSQGWKTFLRNHADGIASLDLFVIPTISFQLLYGLLILKHGRREILCLAATAHPSAEWISRQLMEAYGWEEGPCYLVRDRDNVYGEVFIRRLRAMGIRDRPIAPRSPWQNGYCERLIGSRSDGSALTISWYLASGIFGNCFALTPITTIAPERTCP
jgi:transposase InsO family protein